MPYEEIRITAPMASLECNYYQLGIAPFAKRRHQLQQSSNKAR